MLEKLACMLAKNGYFEHHSLVMLLL